MKRLRRVDTVWSADSSDYKVLPDRLEKINLVELRFHLVGDEGVRHIITKRLSHESFVCQNKDNHSLSPSTLAR